MPTHLRASITIHAGEATRTIHAGPVSADDAATWRRDGIVRPDLLVDLDEPTPFQPPADEPPAHEE